MVWRNAMPTRLIASTAALLLASVVTRPDVAQAGCHLIDCVEDTYVQPSELKRTSCETLWVLRNSIYKDAGYCFKTDRAKQFFGNKGCRFDAIEEVPLNDYQRHNVKVIRTVETGKSC
jgi:hypothetical protein